MKIRHGLLAVLLLFTLLAPPPAQAASEALEWTSLAKPGDSGNVVVTPSEVSEIAVGRDNVIYTLDSANSKFYRSLDGGTTWEDLTNYLPNIGAGLFDEKSKIAIAPDKPGIVAVVTNGGTKVYLSTNGGIKWTEISVYDASFQGTIQTIAISQEYTKSSQSSQSFWQIAIGTVVWGDATDTTDGQVWAREFGELWGTPWTNLNLKIDPSHIGGEVSALAYSPNFANDKTLLAVASTASSDVAAAYQNKTYLCLRNTSGWNNITDYPVEIVPTGDSPGISFVHSSLALPSDYSNNATSPVRAAFVSYDREPTANDDVYRIIDTPVPIVTRLYADLDNFGNPTGNPIDIASIAYNGTTAAGTLLAGDVNPTGLFNVQVRRSSNPLDSPPTWQLATVPPTGPGNARVGWSTDGSIAYCGTGQSPGVALDESALSASLDGDTWLQLGLIDTVIRLGDIAPAPDSKSLFVTTYNPFGLEAIWRTAGDPLGKHWERLLTMDTITNAIILRLSSNYSEDYTMYAAEAGGSQLAVTHDRGNSWRWCYSSPGDIIDIAVADKQTLYAALPGGYVKQSTSGALFWWSAVATGLPDINMLAIVDKEIVLVGGKNGDVAYSTDGGASFNPIYEVIGSGNVQVIADANYKENHTIYAATDVADDGIWRWVIGVSTQWEQIDKSITGLGGGQKIGGLAMDTKGTLYALRTEPASSTSGGMTRSLNPAESGPGAVEFELVNDALPAGTTFDPALAFLNTLPYLKLSGDSEQNDLWAIDTAHQIIYRYQDTLAVPITGGSVKPTDTTASVSWEALAGADKYEVLCNTSPDFKGMAQTVRPASPVSLNAAEFTGLDIGTTYYWKVRVSQPVLSRWSDVYSLATEHLMPSISTDFFAPSINQYDVPLLPGFTWQDIFAMEDIEPGYYDFELGLDNTFASPLVSVQVTHSVYQLDKPLDYGTLYWWRVRAVSGSSVGDWATGTFTTESAPAVATLAQPFLTPSPEATSSIPPYLIGVSIGIGAILTVVLIILAVRTRR